MIEASEPLHVGGIIDEKERNLDGSSPPRSISIRVYNIRETRPGRGFSSRFESKVVRKVPFIRGRSATFKHRNSIYSV